MGSKKYIDLKGKPMPVVTSEGMGDYEARAKRQRAERDKVRITVALPLPPKKK